MSEKVGQLPITLTGCKRDRRGLSLTPDRSDHRLSGGRNRFERWHSKYRSTGPFFGARHERFLVLIENRTMIALLSAP